ncbi:Hsp33 protein [Anaeromyxobacter sp. K]|uniref:Hsp33 family molecular chaperone HslO n=1 Tax=Anaeromyxobacter sp. (strain K) TaxID=447217 RepID=UPI00015F8581|nr:Hsp33 family molecular chaperone HslO [Anaeromyxobacter sp. K]ACG71691.1 Hsp33 protein [Anaeromyxobacter sp. K]
MTDRLCRGLLPQRGLRAVFVRVGDTARMARVLHGLYPTSAHLFAQGLAAGALLGALQKEQGRVNLQIECDGPVGGIFVDADRDGNVRGYVRRPAVHFPGDPARAARAALGGSGFLSVLRDPGSGQYYRSAVELEALDVAQDLRRWFAASEQVETALDLAVVGREGEPLADVGGLLLQKLPDGDAAAVQAARERLADGALRAALARGAPAQEIIREVAGDGFELLADEEIAYRCGCSPERARAAVSALGRDGIAQVLAEEKQAVISCEFCRQRYVIGEAELRDIARRLADADAEGG